MSEYRFSEAVEIVYSLVWDKYADWFLESQKIFKNIPLLKKTLENVLMMMHPFAPFVTEVIWQNLSWTSGMVIDAGWPETMKYDEISAMNFERMIEVVTKIRATNNSLSLLNNNKKFGLLFGEDVMAIENTLLLKFLSHVPYISSTNGTPRGLKLAIANHELYLDVTAEAVAKYKDELTEKILAVGRELDGLNSRMMNPSYVERAPAELVRETRNLIAEKEKLIEEMKMQLNVI